MNFHAIASLLISAGSLGLACFVYLKGKNKLKNIIFAFVTSSISLWSFGQFMGEVATNPSAALMWTRINLAGGILTLVFFVNFVVVFLEMLSSRKWAVVSAYCLGLVFLILDSTPLFVVQVEPRLIFRYYPVPGPTYPYFILLFLFCAGYGIVELFLALFREKGSFRNQITYIFLSSIVGFFGSATLFFPVFGINVYPFGYYFVPIYVLLGVYAIVKHRLLDITVVIRRGLVYSILAVFLSVLYVGAIILSGEVFKVVTGKGSILATIFLLFVFSIVFNPLRERIQAFVDRYFFKRRYDFVKTVKDICEKSALILDLDELLSETLTKIALTFGARAGVFFIRGKGRDFQARNTFGKTQTMRIIPDRILSATKPDIVEEMGDAVVVPLNIKSRLIGLIFLGRKLSDDDYSSEDLDLLGTLANHLSVSVENAILHEELIERQRELCQADKLASLGTLSAGMAHEIKNPLAIIKGLTQSDNADAEKIREVVPRQIDRINDLVEDLLTFSKPKQLRREKVDINSVLFQTVKFVEKECGNRNIEVKSLLNDGLSSVTGDKELLSQAFLNLMLNGMQAIEGKGMLAVETRGGDSGKIEIVISDTGRGIRKEDIKRVFDPFFTTKEKGSGLGLSVTYRIIKEHGGEISVDSEVGKGSTFTISLP